MAKSKKPNSVRETEQMEARNPKRATTKQLLAPIERMSKGHVDDANDKAAQIKKAMSKGQEKYATKK